MKKILVIDDDKIFTKTMNDALTPLGYAVVEAYDGEEGLDVLEKEKPDLVLLDIMMPKLGGIEFLKRLQENRGSLPTPVLIVSNYSDLDNVSKAAKYGVRGYIIKSDESLKTIVDTIKSTIGL